MFPAFGVLFCPYLWGMADIRRTFELDWQTGKFEAGASKVKQALDSVDKELGDIDRHAGTGIKKINTELAKTPANVNKLQGSFSQLGTTIAAAFSVGALISFGKQIVDVTAKFEKLGVMLNTALGDKSQAQKALKQIEQFASKTPFSVEELTESYIKFINRGIKPSMKEMTAIGDLASSQGKSFEELTQGILSAAGGQFDMLRSSMGITSKVMGDKVTLTFKGFTQTVNNTTRGITDAIVAFGQMDGVMGGMDAISETLTGKLSNLGDAWDRLLNTIGTGGGGAMKAALDVLIEFLDKLPNIVDQAFKPMEIAFERLSDMFSKVFGDTFQMSAEQVVSAFGTVYEWVNLLFNPLNNLARAFNFVYDTYARLSNAIFDTNLQTTEELRLMDLRNQKWTEYAESINLTAQDLQKLEGTALGLEIQTAILNEDWAKADELLQKYAESLMTTDVVQEQNIQTTQKHDKEIKNLMHTMATFSDEVGGGIGETMMRLNRMFDEFGSQFPELKPKIVSVTDELEKLDKSIRNNPLFGPGGTGRGQDMGEAIFGDPDDPKNKPEAIIAGIEQVTSAFISAAMTIMDIERQKTETLIGLQEQRVEAARALAEQGNAEILKLEQERLEKLTEEREKFARRQANLALLQTVAESALAIAKAAAEGGGFATAITVASTLAALAAGFAQARALASSAQTFEKGGQVQDGKLHGKRHSQGGIPIEAEGGEWIFSRGTTARHERLFKAIQTGKLTPQQTAWINNIAAGKMNHAPLPSFIDLTGGGNTELLAEVSELTKAVKNQDRMSVTIDENGIQAIASRVSYRQNRIRGKAGI